MCLTPSIPLEWDCRWSLFSIQYLESLEDRNRAKEDKLQGNRLGLTLTKPFLTIGAVPKLIEWIILGGYQCPVIESVHIGAVGFTKTW